MARGKSRPARWAEAVLKARAAANTIEEGKAALVEVFGELEELRNEYENWRTGLPEQFENTELASKLDTVIEMDFNEDTDVEAMLEAVDQAEQAELPLGFGRD